VPTLHGRSLRESNLSREREASLPRGVGLGLGLGGIAEERYGVVGGARIGGMESGSGSGSSLPMRTPLPAHPQRSPPSQTVVLPPVRSRTTSFALGSGAGGSPGRTGGGGGGGGLSGSPIPPHVLLAGSKGSLHDSSSGASSSSGSQMRIRTSSFGPGDVGGAAGRSLYQISCLSLCFVEGIAISSKISGVFRGPLNFFAN